MEPITSAIVLALGTELAKASVKDAYSGLKAVILRKRGEDGPIKAISVLEKDPKSKDQAAVVAEQILASEANRDAEVLAALHALEAQLNAHGVSGDAWTKIQVNVSAGIVQGVAGAENVQISSITFGEPPKALASTGLLS